MMNQAKSVSISIVIPTLNAGDDLDRLFQTLSTQKGVAEPEILIVDSGSCDQTLEHARHYGVNILPLEPACFNHGGTRNLAISRTSGDYVFLFTQDALPQNENFLKTMIESMIQHQAAGVYARQVPRREASYLVQRDLSRWCSGTAERRVTALNSLTEFIARSPLDRYRTCVFDNVASLIRREVWREIPFPPTPFGEDVEWAQRVLCNGYRVVYEPDAVVVHSHERSAEYVYKRTFVDHYRLNELFGVRTIPSRPLALRSVLLTISRDWRDLWQVPRKDGKWLQWMGNVPRYAWASAWGQYHGAKAAASGKPIRQSKDV
jgi:rhamnosyltransferase